MLDIACPARPSSPSPGSGDPILSLTGPGIHHHRLPFAVHIPAGQVILLCLYQRGAELRLSRFSLPSASRDQAYLVLLSQSSCPHFRNNHSAAACSPASSSVR